MTANLVAEVIKQGTPPNQVAKFIAQVLGCSEKTARNKISGVSEFTVPEAMKINSDIFKNSQSIEYLFCKVSEKNA